MFKVLFMVLATILTVVGAVGLSILGGWVTSLLVNFVSTQFHLNFVINMWQGLAINLTLGFIRNMLSGPSKE